MKIGIYGGDTRLRHSIILIAELLKNGHEVVIIYPKSKLNVKDDIIQIAKVKPRSRKKTVKEIRGNHQILRIERKGIFIESSEGQNTEYKIRPKISKNYLKFKPDLSTFLIEEIRTQISTKVYEKSENSTFLFSRMTRRAQARYRKRINAYSNKNNLNHEIQNQLQQLINEKSKNSISDLRKIADKLPSNNKLENQLKKLKLDIVLTTNLVFQEFFDESLIASCRSIEVPTVFSVFSWDNLSTKGSFALEPDFYFVWNEFQKKELIELHETINPIQLVGASRFDTFGETPVLEKQFNTIKILWLGSSKLGEPHDWIYFKKLAEIINRVVFGESINSPVIIEYRMHQEIKRDTDLRHQITEEMQRMNSEVSQVSYILSDDKIDLIRSIKESDLLFGMNTSAILEAKLLGKTVIRMKKNDFQNEMDQITHWKYIEKLCIPFNLEVIVNELKYIDTRITRDMNSWKELLKFIRPEKMETVLPVRQEVKALEDIHNSSKNIKKRMFRKNV